jgi:hypothetical protein
LETSDLIARKVPLMKLLTLRSGAFWLLVAWATFAGVLASPAGAFEATAGAILAAPERYDRQAVTLGGVITKLNQRVSQQGNAYYTFDLQDTTGRIRVFSFGQAPCPEGRQTVVDGTFETAKRVGDYTFYNEITASRVLCR